VTATRQDEQAPIKRRARGDGESGRPRSFWARDETWERARDACHARGVSLGSELHRALERLADGQTIDA
jgi:hypothetical protein